MIIEATKLIGLPVAAEDALSRVGAVKQIVIDPEDGQILGFLVATGFFSPDQALSAMDIKYWDKNGLVTGYEENLVDVSEIVRMKAVVDKNINFLEMSAETASGKSLGQVEDLVIDTDTSSVVKYCLRDMLGKSRVLTSDKVVKIDKKIIFMDDEGEIPSSSVTETQMA